MSYTDSNTKEIPVTSFKVPSPKNVAKQQVKESSVKVSHTTGLGCSDIELLAGATVKSAFSTMRQQIEDCITEGRKLIDIRYSLQLNHGEEEGSRRFKSWLKSKDWGSYGGGWALTSIRLAEFWQKLAPKTQEWVLANLQKLSKGAIKRFADATEIGIDFCLGLVERGKQTGASIDRALKNRKLKVGDRVNVVDGFRKGYSGLIVEITNSSITLEFGDGKRESFTPEQLEKQKGFGGGGGGSKKSNKDADKDADKAEQNTNTDTDTDNSAPIHNFQAGDRVVVIKDDRGWKGARGTVVGEWDREPGSWWVQLDEVSLGGDATKHLYKASQLRLMTVEEMELGVTTIPNNPVEENTNNATSSSHTELYSKEQVDEMLALHEKEMMETFIGSKSKLREEVEREVREEIALGYKLRDKLEAEKRQLVTALEEANQMLRSVQPLADENQQLKTRMADLERALAEKGNNWNQPVFNQEAVKVMDKELVRVAEALSNKVEELEKVCATQNQKIEELSRNATSVPAPMQFQETRKLSEKAEQLELQLKKYQKAEKEAEELDNKLAPITVEKLGITDWRRGDNGEKYRGLSAILNLVKKLITSNQQSLEEEMAYDF